MLQEAASYAPPVLSEHMEDSELATDLKKSPRTLARWRRLREGPPFLRVGRRILYRREAVKNWLLSLEREPGE
jgi:hypothetical protein